jgi:hypothetical protein
MDSEKKQVGRPKKYFSEDELKEAKKQSNNRPEEIERRKEYNKKHNKYIPKNPNCHENSVKCECGGQFKVLKQHLQTKKHINYFENIVNNIEIYE